MDMKGPFPIYLSRIDCSYTFFDFLKLVAPCETRYCAHILYL